MASIEFDSLWLHAADGLADFLYVPVASLEMSEASDAQVRVYAGGRRRVISGLDRPRQVQFTTTNQPREVADAVAARRGTVQLLRDGRGRVLHVMFATVDVTETPGRKDLSSVTVTASGVSGTAEV